MPKKNDKKRDGLFKSIALAYTILLLHVLLLAGLGLLVLFFGGMVQYLFWIVIVGMGLIVLSAYLFYRKLRKEGRSLKEAMQSPIFQGRSLEVSFLGGMASVRLGAPTPSAAIEAGRREVPLELEDPEAVRIPEILELAQLLEKNLITPEEFATAKRRVLGRDEPIDI